MVGQFVHVSGEVEEFWGLTEILLESVDTMPNGAMEMGAMVPLAITTGELGEDCNESGEKYEGLLVTVYNAEIMCVP